MIKYPLSEILLMSGGLDSYVAWLKLNKPPCLHFQKHSKYSGNEYRAVIRLKHLHPEMTLIFRNVLWLRKFEQPDAHIPMRNVHFVSIASHLADKIYLPCQLGEREIPDRSDKFFREYSQFLAWQYGREKTIDPVFWEETKGDLIKWYIEQGYPIENLKKTYSCFSGERERCGRCKSCFRLACALEYNGIQIDDWFSKNPFDWEGVSEYIKHIKLGQYEPRRAEQMKSVLKKRGLWA